MDMLMLLIQTGRSVALDVLPIIGVLAGFQWLVLRQKIPHLKRALVGFGCVILGLVLFLMGLEQALFPLGKAMAQQLTAPEFIHGIDGLAGGAEGYWHDYYMVYLFAFAIGTSAVMVEPAVIAVALKANRLSGGAIHINGLRIAIAVGVGVGITLGCIRIISGGSLFGFILAAYMVVIAQTFFAPRNMIPLAYDSGGVSTSTVTVPIVAALGLGLAMSIPGRSPLVDGFGMIAFAVLFPIMSVLGYAQLAQWWATRGDRSTLNTGR
jgi:hypothetical protein